MKSIKKSYNYKLTLNAIFFLLLSTGNRLPSGSGSASPSIQIRIRIKTNADPLHCSNVSCNLLLATNTAEKEYIQYLQVRYAKVLKCCRRSGHFVHERLSINLSTVYYCTVWIIIVYYSTLLTGPTGKAFNIQIYIHIIINIGILYYRKCFGF